ncbi:DUF6643 family protein [Streptacidiphilus carbonis]|jgi:hypothetical protein|uniref:DUF6643 family protein n=1 Tax=Streptacidiphilus carbonis TaxID=105422 RepID=UPI0005A9E19A|nr:DUF6643 family protein [Streptacidiphilus carbonis]
MTSPRAYDGVGYYAPSFASDTPIYDSLVAERGVPQIAPINVPAALPPAYDTGFRYEPAQQPMPTPRLALGPGPSSPSYGQQQYAQPQYAAQPLAPQPFAPQRFVPQQGIPQQGAPQQQRYPQQAVPQQRYPEQYGAQPQRPVAPVAPLRPVQYQEQYPQQRGGFQGF